MAPRDSPGNPPARAADAAASSAAQARADASGPAQAKGAAASSPAKVTAETARYVTRPTRLTLFLRTFVPWQLWRFARINLKMMRIIRRSRT
jgi:hypothetical protein